MRIENKGPIETPIINRSSNIYRTQRRCFAIPVVSTDFIIYSIKKKQEVYEFEKV